MEVLETWTLAARLYYLKQDVSRDATTMRTIFGTMLTSVGSSSQTFSNWSGEVFAVICEDGLRREIMVLNSGPDSSNELSIWPKGACW